MKAAAARWACIRGLRYNRVDLLELIGGKGEVGELAALFDYDRSYA